VSALAYFLEDEGLPTVAISLIRVQTEKVGNPRSLWVPFELGRPLGPPNNAAFQKDVLAAALGLLTATSGPVILEDYPRDDPTSVDVAAWRPPFELAAIDGDLSDPAQVASGLETELRILAPFYQTFVAENRRTTIGNSGLAIQECARYLASYFSTSTPASPIPTVAPVQALRWVVDDLKAYYLSALSTGLVIASSRQIQGWFWDRTILARVAIELRKKLLASNDAKSQAIGRMNLVPSVQAQRLGLS
jgi:hypothetical protein